MKTCFIIILISFIYSFNLNAEQQENIYWNRGRGYRPFFFATNEGININNQTSEDLTDSYIFDSPTQGFNLSFRAANHHGNPSKRYPYIDGNGIIHKKGNPDWGFFILFSDGDTLKFTIKRTETPNSITSSPETLISVGYPGRLAYMSHDITSGETDCHSGINLWQIKATGERIILYGGNRKQIELASIRDLREEYNGFGFFAGTASDITISDISLSVSKYESGFKTSQWDDKDYLKNRLSSSQDPMEGIWVIFDRNLEESLLKPGGDYVLAIVREDNQYLLIYLEGATVNSQKWSPGMIKGILTPTYFNGIYDTEWIDAEGQSLNNGVKSQYGEGETLTIQFPYHSSSLRLRKTSGFKEF